MTEGVAQRPIILRGARGLAAAARTRRALVSAGAPERRFFLGVEAAADEVLHPELTSTRDEHWLERESPEFRDGYLRTSTMLAYAQTAPEPPRQLALPEPPRYEDRHERANDPSEPVTRARRS